MSSVYESFSRTLKYGRQRNHILEDLTGLEILISMKTSETKKWFKTCFQQSKSSLQKIRYYDPCFKLFETCFQHPFPKGEVFVGSNEKVFYVADGKDDDTVCAFTVHTPTRVFHFTADTEDIKKEWIAAFQSVINTPVTPKEQSKY